MSGADPSRPSFAQATRALLRASVLDAIGELLEGEPWQEVTMAQVAERSGVSRQTLYNEFGSRRGLAQAYVMRAAETFVDDVEAAVLDNSDDPRAALRAAFEVFLAEAGSHPVLQAVSRADDGDELLALMTTRGGPLLAEITERLATLLITGWPDLARADARLVSETVIRLAISHAALPTGPPARSARSLARVLGPYLDELFEQLPRRGAAAA